MKNQSFKVSQAEFTTLNVLKQRFEFTAFVPNVYLSLEARFGDKQPKLGVIYQTPVRRSKGKLIIDTYGRGDVHNVSTPTEFSKRRQSNWNAPMPFPADVSVINSALASGSRMKRLNVVLGSKSDPFMWMDNKYKITHATLEMLLSIQYKIDSFEIHTRSDLVAHDDYVHVLKQFGIAPVVYMHMPRGSSEQARRTEPGAPSVQRRFSAARKLREAGIKVIIVREGSVKS